MPVATANRIEPNRSRSRGSIMVKTYLNMNLMSMKAGYLIRRLSMLGCRARIMKKFAAIRQTQPIAPKAKECDTLLPGIAMTIKETSTRGGVLIVRTG
jgi:hypothetical protein